jgi:SAM-dependent methyltransferase
MLYRIAKKIVPLRYRSFLNQLIGRDKRLGREGAERDAKWYDKAYLDTPQYHCHYTKSQYYFLWCVIADRIYRSSTPSVLDIGCGSGQVANFLFDRGLLNYLGIDLSRVAIAKASRIVPAYSFRVCDALDTDVFETFDYRVAISLEFLEHINDDLLVLSRLRPRTYFIGSVPDFPYPSHVRFFKDCNEVESRYGDYFTQFDVVEFKAPEGNRYFLFEGVKI